MHILTREEIELLDSKGRGWAIKSHHRIIKLSENSFVVEAFMEGDGGDDGFWEFDSEWTSLEQLFNNFN